jgi:hypothetical protein
MIDIDCGARADARGVEQPCSVVMDCRPGLWFLG